MGQALRKAAAGPAVRRSQSIEEVKQYAEFQKSLVERKALLLQQQKQQQKVASTPSPMIPEVHDRQVNIGVERQMLQLLPGITQREVETRGDSSKMFAEKERISKQPRIKMEDFGQLLMLKAAEDEDYGQKLQEHANERGVDAEVIREALKYVRLHSGDVHSIGIEPSPKSQASNKGSQSSSSSEGGNQ